MPHVAGAPSKIDAIVGTDDKGAPITVADRITTYGLGIGLYLEPAIANAGVAKSTVYGWLSVAGKARIRTGGNDSDPSLTAHEQKCIAFSDAVERTAAAWESSKLTVLEQAERGGAELVTITEKTDGDGNVIERTKRTEILGPDLPTIRWRLTRRFPDRYPAGRVELTGREGGPLELSVADRANALADALEAQQELERKAEAARKRAARKKPKR